MSITNAFNQILDNCKTTLEWLYTSDTGVSIANNTRPPVLNDEHSILSCGMDIQDFSIAIYQTLRADSGNTGVQSTTCLYSQTLYNYGIRIAWVDDLTAYDSMPQRLVWDKLTYVHGINSKMFNDIKPLYNDGQCTDAMLQRKHRVKTRLLSCQQYLLIFI